MNPLALFLEPPGPLLTHLHAVYIAYSECLPTRLNPLAERTCLRGGHRAGRRRRGQAALRGRRGERVDPCQRVGFRAREPGAGPPTPKEAQAARAWRRRIHAEVVGAVLNSFQWSTSSMYVGSEWVFLSHGYFCQNIYKADPWPHNNTPHYHHSRSTSSRGLTSRPAWPRPPRSRARRSRRPGARPPSRPPR